MRRKIISVLASGLLALGLSGTAWAQHGHSHGPSAAPSAKEAGPKEPLSVMADGMKVTLEVMSMGEHMKHTASGASHGQADHSQSHSLMVRLQDVASREIVSDARVAFTVTGPSGQKEAGKMTWSGDHYGAGMSLKEKGKYQLQFQVESGGMSRQADFSYEMK
jgi:hypothetical protein